jgi:hypothetical protein
VNAEKWARGYASYATSGAEGSVAMGYVREIQFAHAWMLVTASTALSTAGVGGRLPAMYETSKIDV